MSLYTPEVVSKAVNLGLEAAARIADMTGTLSDDRAKHVKSAIDKMRAAGLLSTQDTTVVPLEWWQKPKPGRKREKNGRYAPLRDPSELAQQVIQEPLVPLDSVLSEAAPYEYQPHERPNARGLPVLSENGYPDHLARITDPQETGRETRLWLLEQARNERRAEVLHQAAEQAVKIREKRAAVS